MLTVTILLLVGAFALTLYSAVKPAPLWPAVLLLCIWALLTVLPLGRT